MLVERSAPATTEERTRLIEETAYLIAERRGFAAGHEVEDWLAAEREIDRRLEAAAKPRAQGKAPLGARALKQLGQQLRDRQAQLLTEIRALRAEAEDHPYAELAGAGGDSADAALADLLLDTENALVSKHILELRDIEAALQKIEAGAYGSCQDCGQDIRMERLRVHPTAKRCVRCQAARERTYPHAPTRVI